MGAVLFTVIYIVCEVIYNLGLVEFLSNANTEISAYDRLEFFGKALASIGLSLFAIKMIKRNKQLIFILLVPFIFLGQTLIFNSVINNLPHETALKAYIAGVYRNIVLNGGLEDDRITKDESYNKVLSSSIPVLGDFYSKKETINRFFDITPSEDILREIYLSYKSINDKIEPFWGEYLRHSKRYDDYPAIAKPKIDKEFKERIGLPQGLSKDEFYREISFISPSIRNYKNVVIIPANDKLGIPEIRGDSFPLGMSEAEFMAQLLSIFEGIQTKSSIELHNLEHLPYSNELIASVVIPPIAITLSMIAIVLNASSLLFSLRKPLVVIPGALLVFTFYTYDHNPYGLDEMVNKAVGVEAKFHSTLRPVANLIKVVSIDEDNPNEFEIIRIKKPEPLDLSDLNSKLHTLSEMGDLGLPEELIDEGVIVDIERLETESSYFGKLDKRGKINPYTGKPY